MGLQLRSKLTLDARLRNVRENPDKLEKAVEKSARLLLKSIQDGILKAPARTGNVYHIRTASGKAFDHRASARGEPPAILTRTLLNSINIVKVSRYRWHIQVDAPYGIYLDSDEYLGRPFFASKIEEHRPIHNDIIVKATEGRD